MRVLHILKTAPDETVEALIRAAFPESNNIRFCLYEGEIDYDRLLAEVLASDRVISWW